MSEKCQEEIWPQPTLVLRRVRRRFAQAARHRKSGPGPTEPSHEEFGSWIDGEPLEQRLQFGPQNLSPSHAIFGVPRKFEQFKDIVPRICNMACRPRSSFVDVAILGILFAIMKALQDRRSPWDQRGLICEALRKVSVILLHDVEDRFLGELSMIVGK
jgi:hypothetical protein